MHELLVVSTPCNENLSAARRLGSVHNLVDFAARPPTSLLGRALATLPAGALRRWARQSIACCVSVFVVTTAIACLGWGCGQTNPGCEVGACPVGYACDQATGLCRLGDHSNSAQPRLFGRFALVARPSGGLLIAGYSPERQSLAAFDGKSAAFLAGPAAHAGEQPAGQNVAAAQDSNGVAYIAWIRPSDHVAFLATGSGTQWQSAQIDKLGAVTSPLAIALVDGQPTVALRTIGASGIVVAQQQSSGQWSVTPVPMPAGPRKGLAASTDFGRSLAMVAMPSGLAISAYDATHGDLVLAVRTAGEWDSLRIAGVDPVTGVDTGDAGDPCALALAPDGALLVAYRDRTLGQIRLARVAGSAVVSRTVVNGALPGPAGTVTPQWVGTELALGVRADGRAAVAWFNGSTWRANVALQRLNGSFDPATTALAGNAGNLQLWPNLTVASDGAIRWAWIEVGRGRLPSAAHLTTAQLAPGSWP